MSSQNPRLPKKRDAPLFFISAGDPSGDAHAARLVSALKEKLPASRFIGFAGPKTAKGHCDVRFDLTKHAAMMLKRALLNLPNYLRLLKSVDSIFREERPDAVILVDFPGFNWQVAKKAKAANLKVGIGGGVSFDSIPVFMKLKPFVDKFETRKVVFRLTDDEQALKRGLVLAMEFELLYLQNKCEFYHKMELEDKERLKMLERRYAFAKEQIQFPTNR